MTELASYPPSPTNIPEGLTKANAKFKKQALLAMAGLITFIVLYLALATCFGYIAYRNILAIPSSNGLFPVVMAVVSSLLAVFMVKSFFTVRKSASPGGIEATPENEPELFKFLHKLADEIGAPRPHRVFITPEVNAAVFYDLSLINLIFPSKKNLIIGLGLVNVLNLGELKAVLAHEFGHFAQGSMAVGRWVYIAQQIISHMVAARDWLDSLVRFVSRIDLRIAWLGWLLSLVIWSIRSLMDTLFRLVIIAERALSREMEFNADLVAVSVTGSDALVNALYKLQSADEAWQTTLDIASSHAGSGKRISDLFGAQRQAVSTIGQVLNDERYGVAPEFQGDDASQHRVFSKQEARPPQMWSTHPDNSDREENAKGHYIAAEIDQRSAWLVFNDPEALREKISLNFYKADKVNELEVVSAEDAVVQRFNRASYSSVYRGTYLYRSPFRNFNSVSELLNTSEINQIENGIFQSLYSESVSELLERARNLDSERHTLEALASGDLKPSGGIIRHRGEELKKADIPNAISQVATERKAVAKKLKLHDANCRQIHLLAAKALGQGWHDYQLSLINLLHCVEHLEAIARNEQALLVNTWQVITADGQIGHFEKRRMLKVCEQTQRKMREISGVAENILFPPAIAELVGIKNWQEQMPKFEIVDVNKKNWPDWCQAASQLIGNFEYAMRLIQSITLDELLKNEDALARHYSEKTVPDAAPQAGECPPSYPVLLPGDEHVLQRKLDLWNRFQLAHGIGPTVLRLIVSLGIVGGTIVSGLIGVHL